MAMFDSIARRFAWTTAVAVACGSASLVLADDPPTGDDALREDMSRLTGDDPEARQTAISKLLETRDGRLAQFLDDYQLGKLYRYDGALVVCKKKVTDEDYRTFYPLSDPLSGKPLTGDDGKQLVVTKKDLTEVILPRRERRDIVNAIRVLELFSPDREKRLNSVRKLGDTRDVEFLDYLKEIAEREEDDKVAYVARESIALIRLASTSSEFTREDRIEAARQLGEMRSARAAPTLKTLIEEIDKAEQNGDEVDDELRQVYQESLDKIESYQKRVRILGYLFSGISAGSILVLMALGLSIIFGQMGVINMAHGELMMIGAYATYEVQRLFGHSLPDNPANMFFVVAVPVAFLSAAFVGWLMEVTIVRRLYGRPLDTLLATWGVGLILIQCVRLRYGDNIGVNSPTWLVGGVELIQDFQLPFNRLFIIALTMCCVFAVYWVMNRTKSGLLLRATVQNRQTAASLGVNTRQADGMAFAMGAGLAGVAGCALTLVGGVTPDMGQNYIVDSFLVVVTGGVGELAGAVIAGLGMGLLNKTLEPIFNAIWAKILILVIVILFIQRRPAGLFPPKGRMAEI